MLDMSTEGWVGNEIKVINSGISQNSSDDVIFLMEGKVNKLEKVFEEIKERSEFTDSDKLLMQQEINEHKKQLNDVLKWRSRKESVMMIFKKLIGQIKSDENTRSSKIKIDEPIEEKVEEKVEEKTQIEDVEEVKKDKKKKKEE